MEESAFKDRLRPVVGNNREAYCNICKKTIHITWMGVKAVKSHMESTSHQARMRGRNSQLPLSLFCTGTSASSATSATSTPSSSTSTALSSSPAPGQSTADNPTARIQTFCTTTATLQAEVLWCLDLAVKHHSFRSNDGIGELFSKMFPDSQIAKSFTLAKDKTGYIIKFGIAPYFKKQLVEAINHAGPYVLMFDESLNESSKKKQMDIHIHFLEDGCVRSRYFGSQFLGHGRANDLLQHIKRYQTDEPVLPFLAKDLTELLLRFIKEEILQDQTPLQLIKLDVSEEKNWVSLKRVDIGLGAESDIKALLGKPGSKIGELSVLSLRKECLQSLIRMIKKLQEKSPLKFPIVRQITCLDPTRMVKDPEWCIQQMKALVQTFIQGQQLASGIAAGDVVIQQFTSFLSVVGGDEEFVSFQPLRQRLDVFLHSKLCTSHPDLLKFCQSALLLSHGQATVERGFSVNKEVETCNLRDESLEALRLICDKVAICGGVLKVPLTKELLASAASARSHYRIHIDSERKKKESATQELRRKAAEKELEDLRNQRQVLSSVCQSLEKDADQCAEMAERKTGTKMAELITKSNTLQRRQKDKNTELLQVEKMIEEKATELKNL